MGIIEGINISSKSLVVPAGACIVGGVIGGLIANKVLKASKPIDTLPEKWVKVGQINDLRIYPVKGMPAISVKEASVGRLGLKGTKKRSNFKTLLIHNDILITLVHFHICRCGKSIAERQSICNCQPTRRLFVTEEDSSVDTHTN